MSTIFLDNFLQVAMKITHADRGLSVDGDMQIISSVNVTQQDLETDLFNECAMKCLQESMDKGEAIITNNVIADISDAPVTNTNFSDLRIVVAIPVGDYGAIYFDKPIRVGVISKNAVEKLSRLVTHIHDNQLEEKSTDDIISLYRQL
jgi:hypothetical protein